MTSDPADRLPPQDLGAEQATLGACFIEEEAAARALALVDVEDFYREAHQTIFAAIKACAERGDPTDVVMVGAELRRRDQLAAVGGAEYLTRLIGEVPTSAHVIPYASVLTDAAIKRRLIKVGWKIASASQENPDDVDELVAFAVREVGELARFRKDDGAIPVEQYVGRIRERLEDALTAVPHVSNARLGIEKLDRRMGGLAGNGLIIPRGKEKSGKSMVAGQAGLASAREMRAADEGHVLVYILEGVDVWEERAIAWLGGFNSNIFSPQVSVTEEDRRRYEAGVEEFATLPMSVTGELFGVEEIANDIRAQAMRRDVRLVIIDHAQLIRGGGGRSAVEAAEERATTLSTLAAEIQCPIIVPSQLTDGDGGRHAKWARAWDESATLVWDIERGDAGADRAEWQHSPRGVFRLHASRRRPPFVRYSVHFELSTGHITDGELPEAMAGYSRGGSENNA